MPSSTKPKAVLALEERIARREKCERDEHAGAEVYAYLPRTSQTPKRWLRCRSCGKPLGSGVVR